MRDLTSLVSVDAADVHKAGRHCGTLARQDGQVVFRYLADWDGPDVATTLPRGDVHAGGPPGAVPPFFAGLLPEGRRLVLLQQALKTSADDELTQLLAVGADTVGDVQVTPTGDPLESPAPRVDLTEGLPAFHTLLAASVGGVDRVGIPGVQQKLSARMQTVPVRTPGQPLSDAILKIEPPDLVGLVVNEAACLDAARAAGLSVPRYRTVHDPDGTPALVVPRFDRIVVDGAMQAVAQEDGCQVLASWPADKYRPSTESVIAALANACQAPLPAALRLWEQVAFSFLVANGDLHAKNLSILHGARGFEPSPIYDVVCTHAYGDHTLALTIGGERQPDRIRRATLIDAATSTGVPGPAMEHALDRLLARTADVPDRLAAAGIPGINPDKLRRVLARRRALLET